MVENHPRIAVLIPTYNATKTIQKTLDSLNANAEPHDIVIVDDGSAVPLDSWLPPQTNLKIIRAPQNGGITKALNIGLNYILQNGYDYVARLDVDDFADASRLEKQRVFMDTHPQIGFIGTWGRYLSEDGRVLFHLRHPTEREEIVRKLYYNTSFVHVSLMLRTSLLREAGGYDERCLIAQDYELVRRLIGLTEATNIPEELVDCTMMSSGLSVKKRRQQLYSRLSTQWRYRDWACVHFYTGLLKTLALCLIPFRVVNLMKR